ncbi:hypothetical protein EVAR_77355_1 [Eumeta japonica]|uniref:Uncharacterized protein n=1 Tax=Eumeta variegata TaxID=151549 RepID=A0A4C1UXT1_EUMVA|nr:hypothetical protein EVAR_77355_1 [Eumeta japonica]
MAEHRRRRRHGVVCAEISRVTAPSAPPSAARVGRGYFGANVLYGLDTAGMAMQCCRTKFSATRGSLLAASRLRNATRLRPARDRATARRPRRAILSRPTRATDTSALTIDRRSQSSRLSRRSAAGGRRPATNANSPRRRLRAKRFQMCDRPDNISYLHLRAKRATGISVREVTYNPRKETTRANLCTRRKFKV